MDKEMIAKINEALKAKDKRELSLDEMDQIVGGADGAWINGVWMTEEQIHTLGQFWVDKYGYDLAADMFCNMTGMSRTEIDRCYNGMNSAKDNMDVLLNRFMQIQDGLESGKH